MNTAGREPVEVVPASPYLSEARALIRELDLYLTALYPPAATHLLDVPSLAGPDVRFFLALAGGMTCGCAALRRLDADTGEIKRMYVRPDARGRGTGAALLAALEAEARAQSLRELRLETGALQHEALELYRRAGFQPSAPFAAYPDDGQSLFFAKRLSD